MSTDAATAAATAAPGAEIVRMEGITKTFPGVLALDNAQFSLLPGEVHALVGENGAGKSTLIKILTGVYAKDSGRVAFDGREIDISTPLEAKALGINAVYQDINMAQHLSVAENFFLGRPLRTAFGTVDWRRMREVADRVLAEYDIHIDSRALVKDLTVAQQEMVTIAKTVHEQAKAIIFDEPTALLANEECDELFAMIRKLKAQGIGIIYISHRLEEIFEICDRVTVMKDGRWMRTMPTAETNQDEIISLMVGRAVEDMYDRKFFPPGEVVLEVGNITTRGKFTDVSFDLRRGEVLGFFGLVGSGRTEVMRAVFGAEPPDSGEIFAYGEKVDLRSPKDAIRKRIGLLPEDRKRQGLNLQLSLVLNTNLVAYDKVSAAGVINLRKERAVAEEFREKVGTRTPSVDQLVRNLSGGNQQKAVVSKWLAAESDIFIFDEPTVGVDVGAKQEIYKILEALLREGHAIVLISSYLPEVMGLSDRLLTMRNGRISGQFARGAYDEEEILRAAAIE
ncbi:MAG: sugar ABC transporter ATP-binding protein [Planctomycetota bacterium]|jgi:ribose transport system ATP-binding protein|nr:sugar ABC transporter ATP-binding protein [Planctomycetota bacterium]